MSPPEHHHRPTRDAPRPADSDVDAASTDSADQIQPDLLADIDVGSGDPPVPIIVWPIDADERRRRGHAQGSGGTRDDVADVAAEAALTGGDVAALSPRLAARVVHAYSRPGDVVVCFDPDPNLRATALAAGCRYRRLRNLDSLTDAADVAGHVRLAVLRWPRPARTARPAEPPAQLFAACRALLGPGGHAVVVLTPPTAPPDLAHAAELVPAARQAGLSYLQRILAAAAPPEQDQPTSPGASPEIRPSPACTDLLILVLQASADA